MNKILAALKLTRIEHSLMLVIAVVAAELLVLPKIYTIQILALSIITPIFVSMGSFAINDYYDIKADRLNKRKDRPLVNGSLTKREALWITMLSFFIGILASIFINTAAFLIALIFSILAILYSYKLKDMLLVGNLYIAFSMVIPFIYGNYVLIRSLDPVIVPVSIIIFLAGLAREIHGMIRDYEGDSKGRKTSNLINHIGIARSSQIAFILYAEAILISIYMFFFQAPFTFNFVYLVPIAITDIVLAVVAVGYIMQKRSKSFFKFSRNASLFAMGLALLAFLLSALFVIPI